MVGDWLHAAKAVVRTCCVCGGYDRRSKAEVVNQQAVNMRQKQQGNMRHIHSCNTKVGLSRAAVHEALARSIGIAAIPAQFPQLC